ncbi:unnamed protein product, partial [Ectocarpus sp. 12 AP-2014]
PPGGGLSHRGRSIGAALAQLRAQLPRRLPARVEHGRRGRRGEGGGVPADEGGPVRSPTHDRGA